MIRLIDGRLAWYAPGASDEPHWLDEDMSRQRLRNAVSQRRVTPCFAVPGASVRLLTMPISAEEKKHLAKSLPFMLEEEVAEDIEALHFASEHLGGDLLGVGICSHEDMESWRSQLAGIGGVRHWLAEPLLLPRQEGEWCLVLEGEWAIVRTGDCEGFTIETAMLAELLAAAAEESEAPQAIIVYGDDQAADTLLLPEALREKVQWRRGNLYSALMLADKEDRPLNLLQGAYAPRLPLGRWWRQWRLVAAVFAAAFALQLVATYADYRQLSSENVVLRTAVQDSYRRAYPRGAVVDPEKQLRRQLQSLRGSGQSSGFVSLMEQVGTVIAGKPGTSIATINYNDKGDEMRMNIVAADYETVEQVRAAMNEAGLEAVMESSSAQGQRVRARLRVGARS